MKISSRWKSVAAVSAVVMLMTACADDGDSSDNDDDGTNVDGIPASEMRSWDVDCDWFHIDDLQDFLGFEEWSTGPMAVEHGAGRNPSGLTCEASFLWPEYESPTGRTFQSDATFSYDLYPRDSLEDAEELFDQHVEHIQSFNPEEDAFTSGNIEGEWLDSYYFANDTDRKDPYFIVLQDEDFVMDFRIDLPNNPLERYDEGDLPPDQWEGFTFDKESAAEFLFEEQMPKVHDQFLTLLERKG